MIGNTGKPVIIEACQFTVIMGQNWVEVISYLKRTIQYMIPSATLQLLLDEVCVLKLELSSLRA